MKKYTIRLNKTVYAENEEEALKIAIVGGGFQIICLYLENGEDKGEQDEKQVYGLVSVNEAIENFASSSPEARNIVENCKVCENSICGLKLNCSYIGRESECPFIQSYWEERNNEK